MHVTLCMKSRFARKRGFDTNVREKGGHFVLNRLLVQRWNYPIEIEDKVSNIPENDYLKSVLDLLEYLECV